jgi:phenylacetate-CoA ligase
MVDNLQGYLSFLTRSAFLSAKGALVARVKYGRAFREELARLERSQWMSAEEFRALQDRKLRALISHSYKYVPYYRRVFDERGLTPRDVETVADLKKLPLLTKGILRAHVHDFVARGTSPHVRFPGWTTGSTGSPINVLRSRETIVFENAMIWRQRQWAGIHPGDRKAAIWGTIWENVIVPSSTHPRPPYWRWNLAENQLLFSYHHLTDEILHTCFDRMERSGVVSLEGFPSTLLVLAQHLRRHGRTLPVKAVFTSSEPLYTAHRELIEDRFQTRVFDLYGQAERVVAATECEAHAGLHLNQEYGITEILKEGQQYQDGEVGEIVGTGLHKRIMPLIRYCTGDLARLSSVPCACGRHMPRIDEIDGRAADLIRTADGREIPGNGIMSAFHGIANVKRTQVVQEDLSTVIVKLEKERPELDVDHVALKKNLQRIVGPDMDIRFEQGTGSIPPTAGKYRWVVSKLDEKEGVA